MSSFSETSFLQNYSTSISTHGLSRIVCSFLKLAKLRLIFYYKPQHSFS
ncbi:hypothetical protein PPL_08890 [Heterostelium album PN500]|uniref:Uncharacterized protein n=1 Tax=Heterostelium pallidum (strain ATCC 26659 / Pp 5 / PN500) TaxID=670386 RepID=D3BK09_HETP5|nr:hypothetical protein PPL_08890 [Heterostelium album PN500]EFA78239.1 hypothetical protein PPL_08890 [Heterostelium album PN500]|eukprot:XP_020430364.1 hypothetical protein PPL_08890 [Heterostelium album PN500]